jgi:hypothetical protein
MQSVLATFQAHMHAVVAPGDAWRGSANGRFSVSGWLARPDPYRPVILRHDPRYPELSHAWIGGLLSTRRCGKVSLMSSPS